MPDETLVLNLHAFANKTVRRDFATRSHDHVLLNLDKRADLSLVADRTAVQIHQIRLKDPDAGA
jgi:hypothetical protein